MKSKERVECPVCLGWGTVDKPKNDTDKQRQKERAVKALRKAGFSIREIMKMVGYKSPRSVSLIITPSSK
jgi:hypothetical protein